ncbi:WGR domain-containing protein [Agrobacterium tumefaciens]|nr:WGR domain-containing protein [Agrobacterium tumefaciens]
MLAQPYQIYVERTDPARNMARYYVMEISETLFGEACLTRKWGRIGARGQAKVHLFDREEEAVHLFLDLAKQKRARGYRPRQTALTAGS